MKFACEVAGEKVVKTSHLKMRWIYSEPAIIKIWWIQNREISVKKNPRENPWNSGCENIIKMLWIIREIVVEKAVY